MTSWRLDLPNIATLLEVMQIYLILFVEVNPPFHLIFSKWASALLESRAYCAIDHWLYWFVVRTALFYKIGSH